MKDDLRSAAPVGNLPILNQAALGKIEIRYPSLPEQRRIVAYLDSVQAKADAIRAAQAATQKELDALMPSARSVAKAFAGEL
jgi:type I restriction enzyme S subunit